MKISSQTLGKIVFTCILGLQIGGTAEARNINKVVYGQDNRQEVATYANLQFRERALSVAGKVRKFRLGPSPIGADFLDFPHVTLERSANVCSNERFAEQLTLPHCTGFLVAPDVLMTAGHCMENDLDCETSSWIFDFVPETTFLEKKNVYGCKEIIKQELVSSWYKLRDYAIIRLDRPVTNERHPLTLRSEGKVKIGTRTVVIGHPSGLPLKIADNAKVRPFNWVELITPIRTMIRKQTYFIMDSDTFAGNSGSPVFNENSGEVEGILIQGANDYVTDMAAGCIRPAYRGKTTWTAIEKAFRVTKIPNLKKLIESDVTK